ncbi:MAG: ABC transporter ATP-binding protein [Desulfobacterales bacterium]|nr:MAG: ABC transporter ATP-binding protein [Desulfobacterales bacterium]
MEKLYLDNVRKEFGMLVAVNGLELSVHDGEFLSLLGPSGCGKTTTLNMMMGYEKPSRGRVFIEGRDVTDQPVGQRDVGMVFQDYAIFLHMTVFENLAFGLRVRKRSEPEVQAEVKKMAEILGLTDILQEPAAGRNMSELQRITVGRSMILKTTILLLDEPLSNLDADLRARMRGELKKFQYELGQTMIYVTHDQVEAMSLSDRIAVMDFGNLQQLSTPYEVYNRPENRFVAGFIGSPPMNFFDGEIKSEADRILFRNPSFQLELTDYRRQLEAKLVAPEVTLGIRPEHVEILETSADWNSRGLVCELELLGAEVVTVLECGREQVVALTKPEHAHQTGTSRFVKFDPQMVHIFDRASGLRVELEALG